jgi:hypothetical protein
MKALGLYCLLLLLLFLTNLDRKIRGRLAWLFNIKELMLASLPCFRNGKQKSAPKSGALLKFIEALCFGFIGLLQDVNSSWFRHRN